MLSYFDEYPIHQTPEPIAYNASSDRNVYERHWFNGFAKDGSYFFGMTLGVYANRGILDCAFSVLKRGELQHCVHASRRLPTDLNGDLGAGPIRLQIIEPMRRVRLTVKDNVSGIACDLIFSSLSAAVKEPRQTLWSGTRRTMDATRYDQFGHWQGWVSHPGGRFDVDKTVCLGIKDRSWGVRRYGEPEPIGPISSHRPLFLWTPIFWEDHVSHAIIFDAPDGRPLVREGVEIPLYTCTDDLREVEDGRARRMKYVDHQVSYHPGTRLACGANIKLVEEDGTQRSIMLKPILKFQQKGIGYGHPVWGHGIWRGDDSVVYESFDPQTLDPLSQENIHVQQVVQASDGVRSGIGILEQFIIGPYQPAGFEGMLDGAPA